MKNNEKMELPSHGKGLKDELWVILPFFLLAVSFFLGSFQYRRGASLVPMIVSAITAVFTGMRLFHIISPHSKIGAFKDVGLAGEFDQMVEEIEEETLKGHYEEPKDEEVTFQDEKKAFLALTFCVLAFLAFGYIVGCFFVIIGTSYYYGYKDKLPLAIVVVSLYVIVYVVLYKLMEAPADFGALLGPLLRSLNVI
jgi:cell division protein FtsW (lipid II flippase)